MRILRPSLSTPSSPTKPSAPRADVKRAPADAFETKAKRSTGLNDAFVPVPKAKPAEIAPPAPPPEPIVIPSIVGDARKAIEAEAEKPLEGPEDKTVYPEQPEGVTETEIGVEGEVEAKTPGGTKAKIKNGVTVKIRDEIKDGIRTVKTVTEDSTGVDASGSVAGVGGSVKVKETHRITREVRVPVDKVKPDGSTDPNDPRPSVADLDPDQPDALPVGTVIREDEEVIQEAGGGVSGSGGVAGGGVNGEHEASNGTTTVIEKTGPTTVKVTQGPTSATTDTGGFDVSLLGIKLGASGSGGTEEAHLQTAEFDLSTEAGRAAYEEYRRTGKLPTENGPGVGNVARIDKTGTTSSSKMDLGFLGIDLGKIDDRSKNVSTTRSTKPDGSVDEVTRVDATEQGMDGAVVVSRSFLPDGTEDVSKRKVEIEVRVDKSNVDAINAQRKRDGKPLVKVGDKVTLPANQETVELMRKLPQHAAMMRALAEAGAFGPEVAELARKHPEANIELLNHCVNVLGMSAAEVDEAAKGGTFKEVLEGSGVYIEDAMARLAYIQAKARAEGKPIGVAANEIPNVYDIDQMNPQGR